MRTALTFLYNLFLLVAAAFHVWTCYIAFTFSGWIAALLTAILPVFGEFYWMYQVWSREDFQLYLRCGIAIAIVGLVFVVIDRD